MSLIQAAWDKIEVTSPKQLRDLFEADKPNVVGLDTETDGVFSMTMQPFLIIFGWKNTNDITKKGKVVVFEPTTELMETVWDLSSTAETMFMHNAKFDLHTTENFYKRYPAENIIDTMIVARLTLESKTIMEGGPSLALKNLADKYIERNSSKEQKIIKQIKQSIKKQRSAEFEKSVSALGLNPKQYSTVKLEQIEDDPILEVSEVFPPAIATLWENYKTKYPRTKGMKKAERITYKHIYEYSNEAKTAMKKYAFNDVIYTIELGLKFLPYVEHFGQKETLDREMKAMYALYNSERIGIKIDLGYINKSKEKMKAYIIDKRDELADALAMYDDKPWKDDPATFASSPKQIKEWLKWHDFADFVSTSKDSLQEIVDEYADETQYGDFYSKQIRYVLQLVLEHRQLIKKYSTDLLQYLVNEHNGRRYTTFNQAATVTGRLSNDMQQMPNVGITDDEGNLLFDPRAAVIPSGNGYSTIAYLDYSQVELRIQAHYTWLAMAGEGDTNMLRMYVPFKCYTITESGRLDWDPKNSMHTKQPFISAYNWKQNEDDKDWEITDMHLKTAMEAFPHLKELDPSDPEVQKFRKKAKPVNFGIQYGAGIGKIIDTIGNKEDGTALYNGNRKAFPGLPAYALWLKKQFNKNGYVENAYGRKYKFNRYTHKMNNYVIQGSGADLLKEKAAQAYEFLKDKKSRLIHNIHDELQFEIHDTEPEVIKQLQVLMGNTGDKFIVPILADIETTKTNWAEKQEGII